jgi:large subunit ribosomal protein L10
MPKPIKVDTVKELKKFFQSAGCFFVTDYQGLNVADISKLRKALRESDVKFVVAKNTLFKIAANEAGSPSVDEHLHGPTAIAFALKDAAVAAKILNDSFKEKKLPRVKVFVLDNEIYQADQIGKLADLPPREILLSHLVRVIELPLTELLGSVDAVFTELIRTVDALAEKQKASA